jgi:uncharacterized protein YecE (DUF72 family)
MPRAWVGTSGFSYKEWKPSFYPADLPDKQFLAHYATRLRSVEIDYTFYRMPNAKTLDAWKAATPETFRFAVKASQKITHWERLQVPSEALAYFTGIVPRLGERLGVVLFQLPPFFRSDLSRLDTFLGALPADLPRAFEFRHASWFTPEVYEVLRRHSAGLCIHDADESCTPLELTAGLVYVRLRKSTYAPPDLEAWRARIREWVARGAEVFAYVKHEENPDAPQIALALAEGLA